MFTKLAAHLACKIVHKHRRATAQQSPLAVFASRLGAAFLPGERVQCQCKSNRSLSVRASELAFALVRSMCRLLSAASQLATTYTTAPLTDFRLVRSRSLARNLSDQFLYSRRPQASQASVTNRYPGRHAPAPLQTSARTS